MTGEERKRVVMFSRCIPYEGIDHAGGEYVWREIRALAPDVDFTVVAPANPANLRCLSSVSGFEAIVIQPAGWSRTWPARAIRRAQERVGVPRVPFGLRRSALKSVRLREALLDADLVEYQWTEMAGFASVVRRHTAVPSVVVVHDVLSQRFSRAWRARRRTQWLAAARGRSVERYERRLLSAAGAAVTFSEKDRDLLRGFAGPNIPISVVHPPLDEQRMNSPRDPDDERVLLVGNFTRRENRDAALWFGNQIWPRVRRERPNATWVLAGVGSQELLSQLGGAGGIVATGYVEDLGPQYQQATVCVVPVRLGAGVKFKTLTAMLWGVPLVTTPQGAEGLCGDQGFTAVTNDPAVFCDAVLSALSGSVNSARAASIARDWARAHAGTDAFVSKVTEVYGLRAP